MDPEEMVEELRMAAEIGAMNGGIDLNEWEENFLLTMDELLADGHELTDNQAELLEKLYDKL